MLVAGDWTIGYALEQASPAAGLSFTSGGELASMIIMGRLDAWRSVRLIPRGRGQQLDVTA